MSGERFVFPTSFAQRRLWFVHQLEPESAHYNVPMAQALSGTLDVSALHRALVEIVGRHEALRTTFTLRDGEPVQVIGAESDVELPVLDVSALADSEVRGLVEEEAQRPFDLERGPLLRARLLRRGADEHVFLLSVHHIVFDGWSTGVLFRELGECYRAFACGVTPSLPNLPVQYGDYAVWQRDWLRGDTLERQLAHWRSHLAGAPPELELPTDRLRSRTRSYRGSTETLVLSPRALQGLAGLGRQEGATLFMTLLAGFQALLARYSGADDLIVGSPVANRTRIELEPLIGFFVNSLPLRADLSGDPSFRELLRRIREVTFGAFEHQDLPFEKLVEELRPERIGDRNPLFQVMFALQNASHPPLTLPGLVLRPVHRRTGTAKFDLTLNARETSRGLALRLQYSTDLFEADTIRRMLGHLEVLLEGILADPERRLSALPLLPAEERHQAVAEWNRTDRRYPGDQAVHQLFEIQADQQPESIAVEAGDERLTYRELNRRANQLARFLQRHGVGREARVAVALERSCDLVVALLGVLKAGAAYVPLDLVYPSDRVALMLEDAGASAVVTRAGLLARVPGDLTTIELDRDAAGIAREPGTSPGVEFSPEQLAYVMYTSGSSGRPKGVAIPHRAIVRLVCNADYVQLTREDRVAQVSNAAFDAATFEVWGALLHGARLVVIPREVVLSPGEFAVEVGRRGISAMFLTTALFNQMVGSRPDAFRSVRHLIVGGEALDPGPIREVLRQGPPERLMNGYGPTETTTFATWHLVRDVPEDAVIVPIGLPIGNTCAYVLDRNLQPVPVGVAGELFLGGPGLARGYFNRPALTAERFVPDPFAAEPGGRLYRTGDRVRRRADGVLEFLGRFDDQVKLRGFRIEPREVEAAIGQHPGVSECAVMLRDDLPTGRGLLAYLVPQQATPRVGQVPASASPREHLAAWGRVREEAFLRHQGAREGSSQDGLHWTVERLLRCRPGRVIEIGSGGGELLFRLLPHCLSYTATEWSERLSGALRARVDAAGVADRVKVVVREPTDLSGFGRESSNLVVLDSVIQCLPGVQHLMDLLEGLTAVLAPGGAIFLGNVPNLELVDACRVDAGLQGSTADGASEELRARLDSSAEAEARLLISPKLFLALPRHLHRIRRVEILLRRGAAARESTRFHYDVVLHSTLGDGLADSPAWTDWTEAGWSMARVERTLKDPGTRTLAIGGAPNARTIVPASVAAALASGAAPATIRELVEAVTAGNDAAVDPETLCELGEALGFRVELGWGRCDPSGRFDVLFQRAPDSAIAWPIDPGLPVLPWQRYANQPQLKTAAEPLVPAVRAHLRERLPDFMIPTAFVVVDALPLSPNGKLDVRSLPSPAEHAWLQEASAPPRTPVEQALAGIWQRLLGVEAVGLDDNFFEVGGHSLLAVKLFGEIEQTFGRKLPLSTLFRAPTLGRLAEAIGAAAAAPSASALAVLHPHGSRPPLILIHGVQGDVMEYRELVKGLGPDQPVYGIEALDAGQSGTVLRTIEQLAKGYVEALRQHQPTGPYFLCGYCWAGALTFEIAQQLRRKGDEVALLAMIDAGCPGHRRRRRPRHGGNGRPKRSTRILRNLKRLPEMDWATVPRFLWDRTLRLATELAGVTAFRLSARLGRALFPAFQARRQTYLYAARAYRPREYPGRLTLFRGSSDGTVSGREALLGWERVVSGGVELHWVPGAHVGMLREPNVAVLARELQAALERARTGGEPISRDEPCEPHP